jgi:myo-inositol-1(or 4)-monophosphatase
MQIDARNLSDWRTAGEEAARRGAALLEQWRSRFAVRAKGRADLVTDADHASQNAVQAFLRQRFPDHGFLGEESVTPGGADPRVPADAPPTWIVDPLDGTTNYVHDCPMYCVSIGLWAGGDLVVGVIFDPRHNEMFAAAKGQGAWLNGQRIAVSQVDKLENALLSTGFAPDLRGQERSLRWWEKMSFKAQSLRRTGSTALNLAYVAAGRFDGYWAFDNHVWDIAGGVVMVREAGGLATGLDGGPLDPFQPTSLVSNGLLHPELIAEFAG